MKLLGKRGRTGGRIKEPQISPVQFPGGENMRGTLLPFKGGCSNTRDPTWPVFVLYLGYQEPLDVLVEAENHRLSSVGFSRGSHC